jgi:hypothetical protein
MLSKFTLPGSSSVGNASPAFPLLQAANSSEIAKIPVAMNCDLPNVPAKSEKRMGSSISKSLAVHRLGAWNHHCDIRSKCRFFPSTGNHGLCKKRFPLILFNTGE